MHSPLLRRAAVLAAVAALPLLAGCGGRVTAADDRARSPCPRVAMLADAVDLTRYRPGARPDIGTVEVDARIEGVQARCDYAPRNAGLDVVLTVSISAERGPAATARTMDLPYIAAVIEANESAILSRGADTIRVQFPSNQGRATARGEELLVRIPGEPREAAGKTVLVGFQLTPDQLEANRRRGVR